MSSYQICTSVQNCTRGQNSRVNKIAQRHFCTEKFLHGFNCFFILNLFYFFFTITVTPNSWSVTFSFFAKFNCLDAKLPSCNFVPL